ncbi:MAG: hypothetical protein R2708_26625 [Vicinamibacterales bacterium]
MESLRVSDTAPRQLFAFTHAAAPGASAWPTTAAVAAERTGVQPPTNLRVVSIAGSTVTLAWNLPASGPTPQSLQLEGGIAPGQVLGPCRSA